MGLYNNITHTPGFWHTYKPLMCFRIHALLMSLCLILSAYGHTPVTRKGKTEQFHSITTLNGLPSNKVLDILQDHYGLMWFATTQGLASYDGNHFQLYQHNDNDSLSLSDNIVTALTEDKDGNLWVGTKNGLNRYDRIKENFVRYLPSTHTEGLKNASIKALHTDSEGILWIETAEGYLTRLDYSHRQWKHFKHNPGMEEGEHYYWHIFEDSHRNLWLGGRTLQGEKFDIHSETFQTIPTWSEKGIALENSFYLESEEGTLFSSSNGSIQKYDTIQKRFVLYCPIPMEAHCAVRASDGNYWIGGNHGLLKWNKTANIFTHFTHETGNPTSLSSNQIFCLYASQDGCIWIGTDNGISIFSPALNAFSYYKDYQVTALMQDREENLWIGTRDEGSYRINLNTGTTESITYRLMTQDIDHATFLRERENIRQYIRHEAIHHNHHPLPERLADDYAAYKKANPQFMFPKENTVSSLYQDKQGIIYIGLWNHVGFNSYNPSTGEMKRHALWSKKPDYDYPRLWLGNPFGANWYNGFLEDSRGRFWCITWECFGLNLFNRKKGQFESKHYFPNNVPCFPQGKIERIIYDRPRQQLILLGTNTYFGYYDLNRKRFYKYGEQFTADYPNLDIVKGYYAYSKAEVYNLPLRFGCADILSDNQDRMYITDNRDILCMSLKDNKVFPVYHSKQKGKIVWTLSTDGHSLIIHQAGKFFCIDTQTHRTAPCPQTFHDSRLSKEEIQTLYQAKDGSVWIGSKQALWIVPSAGMPERKPSITHISLIKERPDGSIYVVSPQGLHIFRAHQQSVTLPFGNLDRNKENIPATAIRDIHWSTTGEEWLATDNGLICLKDQKIKEIFLHDKKNPHSLTDNNVLSVCSGPDQQLWIGTFQGICLYDIRKQTFKDMSLPGNDCLTSRLASCILEDTQGRIWIGTTEKGVNVLTQEDTIAHFWHHPWEENSLPDNYVECIHCDHNGQIRIGTHNGVGVYQESAKNFTQMDGLSGYQIRAITEDDNHFLWISTNNGLFVTDRSGRIKRTFYKQHGLQGNDFSRAACKLKDGRLAFGGESGFNLFNPQPLTDSFAAKRIIPSKLRIKETPFPVLVNEIRKLNLNYSQNSFSLDFSAADYEFSPYLKYRYRLLPFDTEWIYTTPPFLTAKYARIPFGHYTLEIEASNAYGEWSGTPYKLLIHISPPWYFSWWFLSTALLSSIVCIAGIIRFRERHLRKRNEQLESLVSERTEKLKRMMESRNKFFNIISHDLNLHCN